MAIPLVNNETEDTGNIYDEETLKMLENRRDEFLKGNVKGFTVEESMEHVRKQLQDRMPTPSQP